MFIILEWIAALNAILRHRLIEMDLFRLRSLRRFLSDCVRGWPRLISDLSGISD